MKRHGVTLVEVLISCAVLGLALAPIVGIVHKSFSDIRKEKNEATAATFAGGLLSRILAEATFEQVLANNVPGVMPGGTTIVDGCDIQWETERNPMTNLRFLYRRFKYHFPEHTGTEVAFGAPGGGLSPTYFMIDPAGTGPDQFAYNNLARDVDFKFAGSNPVLCEVRLRIHWRSPGDAAYPTTWESLYVRKAKL